MSTKTSSNEYLQVVFLIDENLSSVSDEITVEDVSTSVCLCVLRILSYFNELRDQNSSFLHWGFKFYNSRSLNQRYQRHNFKDFSVSEFENFEKVVRERFEEEIRSRVQEQNDNELSKSQTDAEEFGSNASNTRPTASKSLTCALTDLVHDFQWEINDLNSPLRATRRSKSLRQNSRRTYNIVFLLSRCPRNFSSLREFTGFKIQDLNSLRNVMMSTALFREFSEVYKINLNWINTDYNGNDVIEEEALDLMEGYLQLFKGSVISLQSLVGTQTLPSTQEASNSSWKYDVIFPVTSVLSQYLGRLKCAGVIDHSVSGMNLQLPEETTGADSNLWVGWLCSSGVKPVVHCTLQLSSMLSSHCSKNTETSYSSCNSNPTLTIGQKTGPENKLFSYKISTSAPDVRTMETGHNNAKNNCPNVFWIKGAVRREKICPSWFHLIKVYSCVAMVTERGNGVSSSGLSGWFQRLLLTLAKRNLSLVIELRDPESGIPVTSVLQPLTSVCGVLSVVNSCKLLTLEKLLLWNQKSSLMKTAVSEHLLVKDMNIPETICGTIRHLTSSEVHCALNAQSLDGCSPVSFCAQDLNSWSLGLACLEPGPDLTQPASEKCPDDGTSHESSLIKKLKELYSKKRSKKSKIKDKKMELKQIEKRKKGKYEEVKKLRKQEPLSSGSNTGKENVQQSSCNIPNNDSQNNDADATSEDEKKEIKILLESLQLDAEQDLKNFLKDAYHQAVTNMDSLTKFIDKCIAVIDVYLRKNATERQEITLQGVLADFLLLSNLEIRDKYEGLKTSDHKQNKLTEYQLQVLLRLEIICAGGESSPLTDEVVVMLRSILFIKDQGLLRDFLKEVILARYVKRIPKILCEIYEGLMQNIPPELRSPSKQSSDEEESPLKRSQIPSVVRPESDQPCSNRSRPLTRHRSIADMGGKRREIVIPGKAKTKSKTGKQDKEKSEHHKGKTQKTPVKKVRRNLFTEEEEVTEANDSLRSKSKLKVPLIFGKEEKSHHHRNKERRRHSVSHSKLVKETPGRKQVHNALWQKQHRARNRTSTVTDLNIVKESPLKEILEAESLPRRSPRRHPGSIFQRSQSFYGANPKSCPLVRTRSSSSIRGESPIKKLDLDENTDASNLATDAMETRTTPVKDIQDTVKESPLRFSPRKRKRFTLHTLLTETTSRAEQEPFIKAKAKASTPRSKGEGPVRSSPRLLKKRSFSCIGFSLSSYSKSGNSSGDSKIRTPSKDKILTPTRSSPRFKKSASDSTEMARNRDGLSSPGKKNRWDTERRKRLHTLSRSGLPDFESFSGNSDKNTRKKSTSRMLDSTTSTKIPENENDSEDSEIFLNLNKETRLDDQSECSEVYHGDDRSNKESPARRHGVDAQDASPIRKEGSQDVSPGAEERDVGNEPPMDMVNSGIEDDDSRDDNTRIVRSGQKKASSGSQFRTIAPSPRNKVFSCISERNGGRSQREVLSRKRLSFSPSKKMDMTHSASENASNASLDGGLDDEDNSEKTKPLRDEAMVHKKNDDDCEVDTISNDAPKVVTPLRRSPRKHLPKNSPVCGAQRLLTPKPAVSTPPAKKRRKTRSQTEQETKRSSPLNQILKQRKRNRTRSLKSPKTKQHPEVGADSVADERPRDVISEGQADYFAQMAMDLLDECSKSSEDMVYDWYTHIDKQENTVEPTAMTSVLDINNVQTRMGLADFGYEDEDVFQNPPKTVRSGKTPYKPATPISAKSIKMLRESPLLVNSPSMTIPLGSLSKKWSDSSPSGRERLRRRKRSEAFGGSSSELDTSTSDRENVSDRNSYENSTRSRKKLKLNTE